MKQNNNKLSTRLTPQAREYFEQKASLWEKLEVIDALEPAYKLTKLAKRWDIDKDTLKAVVNLLLEDDPSFVIWKVHGSKCVLIPVTQVPKLRKRVFKV